MTKLLDLAKVVGIFDAMQAGEGCAAFGSREWFIAGFAVAEELSATQTQAALEAVRPLLEKQVRAKVVSELRHSAFLHCDVNKEDVLLTIKHGTTLMEARKLEAAEGRSHEL